MLSFDYLFQSYVLNIEHVGAVALSLAYLWYKVQNRFKPVLSWSKSRDRLNPIAVSSEDAVYLYVV